LKLYSITEEDLLSRISEGLKNPILRDDIFTDKVKLSHLKKIDRIFKKGLHFYLDPKTPVESKEASIFFRKQSFNSELNIGARKIVNLFEEEKISLSAISKLAEFNLDRKLPIYTINDNPEKVATHVRDILYPSFNQNQKEFLKSLISNLSDNNVFVFEFVETWNKIDKTNIDGFYLSPNVVVLKRQKYSFRREIFTLAHELGHYLLNEEEIEKLDLQVVIDYPLISVERWCHDFAYYFLVKEYEKTISNIKNANNGNDYQHDLINDVRDLTHLSRRALYTRLLLLGKISPKDYNIIRQEEELAFKEREVNEKKKRELEKAKGIISEGRSPKPIISPLLIKTVQVAFYEGVINEAEFCRRLNIKPKNFEMYLQ
jgi:Zn-dependent peptidase ImmA (M78 family)